MADGLMNGEAEEQELSQLAAALGRRGGAKRSARKAASCRANLERANAAKLRLRGQRIEAEDEDPR
jgi:hypothetical protein